MTSKDNSRRYLDLTKKVRRLPNHNYGWTGTYFITIDAIEHEPIFEIPELRTILIETWQSLPARFHGLTLDEFIIMPDHVHFMIRLEGNVEKPTTLALVVGAYKSLTSVAWLRHIKANNLEQRGKFWQRGYFDEIIRDQTHLEQTRLYIRNNPLKLKNPK